MNKATAVSPANIAFIKYWGRNISELNIPNNDSISMNLSNCLTTTTVELSDKYREDEIQLILQGNKHAGTRSLADKRTIKQLDRIRQIAGTHLKAKVITYNSFPADAGIASSASGFSALSLAGTAALDLTLDKKELSRLSRLGSGSACRSIPDGFAIWEKGVDDETSFASQLKPVNWWRLVDIVAIVSTEKKKASSLSGHALAKTSPYYSRRLELLPKRTKNILRAIKRKNIGLLGQTIEEEAIDLHLIAMSARDPVFYWNGATIGIMKSLREWRSEGVEGYFTMDAGANVHVICERKHEKELNRRLNAIEGVQYTIVNYPAEGARLVEDHLF